MGFFAGLFSFFLIFWAVERVAFKEYLASHQTKAILAAAVMFVLVGISHFSKPEKLEAMMEGLTKHKRLLNYSSGLFEIVLGIGLISAQTRTVSAIGLLLLLTAVFPANIFVARKNPGFYNISRLFFQPVYMIWIWWAAGLGNL